MTTSVFSFVMSILCCNILLTVNFLLYRNKKVIFFFNIYPFLALILFSILRLLFYFEIPGVHIIHSKRLFPLCLKIIAYRPFHFLELNIGHIILIIWGVGFVFFITKLMVHNLHFKKYIMSGDNCEDEQAYLILDEITNKNHRNFKIIFSSSVNSPLITGFFKPTIYMPKIELSKNELHYILLHEWSHYKHKDLWLKLFIEIICSFYWWNPFIYLLKYDLDNVLELKNDYLITKKMDETEKTEYLDTILHLLKTLGNKEMNLGNRATNLCLIYKKSNNIMTQRFQFILTENKQRRLQKVISFFCYLCIFIFFIFSFSMVIQPYTEPPKEEDFIIYNITPETSYILERVDHSLGLYIDGQYIMEISDEEINNALFSTLEIKNEESINPTKEIVYNNSLSLPYGRLVYFSYSNYQQKIMDIPGGKFTDLVNAIENYQSYSTINSELLKTVKDISGWHQVDPNQINVQVPATTYLGSDQILNIKQGAATEYETYVLDTMEFSLLLKQFSEDKKVFGSEIMERDAIIEMYLEDETSCYCVVDLYTGLLALEQQLYQFDNEFKSMVTNITNFNRNE